MATASSRIARLAAIRVILCAVAPALTAIALGALLGPIGDVTWARYGYSLAPDRATELSLALIGAGFVVLAAGVVLGVFSRSRGQKIFLGPPPPPRPRASESNGLTVSTPAARSAS